MMLILAGFSGCGAGGGVADGGGVAMSGPTALLGAGFGLLALFAVWVAWRQSAPGDKGKSPATLADHARALTMLAVTDGLASEPLGPAWYVPTSVLVGEAAGFAPCSDLPREREPQLV